MLLETFWARNRQWTGLWVIFDQYRNKMDDRWDISHHVVFLTTEKMKKWSCMSLSSVFTWSEHLLSHEQVIESADVVPARQEDQYCSFLSDKDMTQHLAAERHKHTKKQTAKGDKQPLAEGASATTEPSGRGACVLGGAEADRQRGLALSIQPPHPATQ